MKKIYFRGTVVLAALVASSIFPELVRGQDKAISGQVRSAAYHLPLKNAQVMSQKGKVVVLTDAQGRFALRVEEGDKLRVALPGYGPAVVSAKPGEEVEVFLLDNPLGADTTYQTLFGAPQKRHLSTAAVSEIYGEELEKTASRTTAGLVVGRVPGLYGSQSSGEPGGDNVSLSLRGGAPFVMVDGTPQSFGAINPEQIESITFLKDALSTVMLGNRSSNGVMYITTKKGGGKGQSISFRTLVGVQEPIRLPKPLDAYSYATLYNEAFSNDGNTGPLPYSQEALASYQDRSDPYSFPDVNWYDAVLKKRSSFSRYDVAVSGGGERTRYFVNLDYLNQGGLFKTSDLNTYNTNADFKRYGFRSNLGVDLSKALTANLNLAAQIQNGNEPGATVPSIFSTMLSTPNNAHPVLNPNGSLAGTDNYTNNPWGQTLYSGYRLYNQTEFKTDLALKADLGFIIPGLWARGTGAYKNYLLENINRSKRTEVFEMAVNAAGDTSYTRRGPVASVMENAGSVNSRYQMLYTELAIGLDRKFGAHGLSVLLNASNDNIQNGDNLDENFRGLAGRASYHFNERYLAEFAFGYNGVERFAKGRRYGFFPAFGLGWNIGEEDFLQPIAWLDQLKLRGSYGMTGNVNAGYFAYNQYYVSGTGYNIGETPTGANGIAQGANNTPANPFITWEKARKLNLGVDASLFGGRVALTAEYFKHNFFDLVRTPSGSASGIFGGTYPSLNLGKLDRTGTEFQVTYQDNIGGLNFFLQPNVSFVQSVNVFIDELEPEYPWLRQTGLPGGQPFGYVAEGLFQTDEEARTSPVVEGYTRAQAGDIKYRDLNQDGVINGYDRTAIGHQKPLAYYGVALGASFAGFDVNALLQGVENRQVLYTGSAVWEFQNNGRAQSFAHHLDRWTPENAANATYPRLSIGTNINNHVSSSYWLRSGDYWRLKNLEIGYTLPAGLTQKVKLATVRVFFNGTNLLTKAEFDEVDPEVSAGGYPLVRTVSGGLNVKF
ncbi:SusC/RagA family TonB-linked outer membrane protein [Rufibacter psychrotolerans]|uniref:SusC/RagA family TonB-linked outer membrane protein n=1 Tax=Rufibacter psychrotolerans TaxID=2812556 RepID=UPI001967C935|nr:SusC/RagA family TonB-linked outer membrane protein [Rufibacter sp. SYSU D00308]